MHNTEIITHKDLEDYAKRKISELGFPEILHSLIRSSAKTFYDFRIPYSDAVRTHGLDGFVHAEGSYFPEYLPNGESCWEFGVDVNPQSKATSDYEKRTTAETTKISVSLRQRSVFVFVTPRSTWTPEKQQTWCDERKEDGWKDVKIIDGIRLKDWLRELHGVGILAAQIMGISKSYVSITTPTEHWRLLEESKRRDDITLPYELFLENRDDVISATEGAFKNGQVKLPIFVQGDNDLNDFVAAYVQSLIQKEQLQDIHRCLYINESDAWMSVVQDRAPHVLLAGSALALDLAQNTDLATAAIRAGHSVLFPISSYWSNDSPHIVRLKSPTKRQIESVLLDANFPETKARELADIGNHNISAIRRAYHGLTGMPEYASWDTARVLSQAQLINQWNQSNKMDTQLLEDFLGNVQGENLETLKNEIVKTGSPLIKKDEWWVFANRAEVWASLGNRILDKDIEKFKKCAVKVLSLDDDNLDLAPEERDLSSIYGSKDSSRYSNGLMNGVVETIALLGTRSKSLTNLSEKLAKNTALLIVRELLLGANWKRWASLDSFLPLLAESAPDEFLDAVEKSLLDLNSSPFNNLIALENDRSFGKKTYMCGLLWALESLAWSEEFLHRVSIVLSELAYIDTGGKVLNRPINSLVDIFLPWHVQTTASVEDRCSAIRAVLIEHPSIGWELLLKLLPHSHGHTTGTRKPTWLEYIPSDWNDKVTKEDYWKQITFTSKLCVDHAFDSAEVEKIIELVERLPDLVKPSFELLIARISSTSLEKFNKNEKTLIWEELCSLVRTHRNFADAKWALPDELLATIESSASKIEPNNLIYRYRYLFTNNENNLYSGERTDYKAHQQKIESLRLDALSNIIEIEGSDSIHKLVEIVSSPYQLGSIASIKASNVTENELIGLYSAGADERSDQFLSGYVRRKYFQKGWDWVKELISIDLPEKNKFHLFLHLPFNEKTWEFMAESLSKSLQSSYWRQVIVNPYSITDSYDFAVEKLSSVERFTDSIALLANLARSENLNIEMSLNVLERSLNKSDYETTNLPNPNDVLELLQHLQSLDRVDAKRLSNIEWGYLSYYDESSAHEPITLERDLSEDGKFFSQVIALAYRSSNEKINAGKNISPVLSSQSYRLLDNWSICPGTSSDGIFDIEKFNSWYREVKAQSAATGHLDSAMYTLGRVFIHAPQDPGGLWIDKNIAAILNAKNAENMRQAFSTKLFNNRGIYTYTNGEEEKSYAEKYILQAKELQANSFVRFATTLRELGNRYLEESEEAITNNPFE